MTAEHANLNRKAALASIVVALLLVGMKLWAVLSTGSASMLGSLADTALDFVASVATLIGVWVAAMPDDANHRFGHGKAEALAAMFQVVLISISAIGIAFRAVGQFLGQAQVAQAETGVVVSAIAMAATLALLAYQRHVIRQTQSLAISTDNVHYKSDLFLNLAVIAALLLEAWAGIRGADAVFAFGIALWLAWGAWGASQAAVDQLMDHEWPLEKRERFLEVVSQHPELKGLHDLRTRTSGDRDFVQFHVWIDGRMTVTEAHRVMDEIEEKLMVAFPGVEILIHPDPEGLVDEGLMGAENLLESGVDGTSPAILAQGAPSA
ncbi:MAG: cation diffusion facilitator family transporter [Novosphingobium sp.]|uniref:cation diffusion facilitator family transporter n=1 Tax=Novosphingobium sp. TaxID=1874826 RepID=UPI00273673B7|nr:cation diffusion facilitator family transporter [Novosphingobium sp.]MDP3551978.1 cation diffusion facilitator family transporter [Novosphingobium sp.]